MSTIIPLQNGKWILMRRVVAIFLFGLASGVGGVVAYHSYAGGDGPASSADKPAATDEKSGTSAGSSPRRSVIALGTLEPRDGVVQISSPLIGYQVKQVVVQDGQLVHQGDVLVELDSSAVTAEHELALSQRAEALERQQAEISLAKERVGAAELAVRQATDGRELELAAQKSRISLAEAKKKQVEKEGDRLEQMSKLSEPLATKQQVEQQRFVGEAAAAELEAAQIALKRLEQTLNFQEQTAAAELRSAQQSLALAEKGTGIESLNRHVELAELKLKQAKITAPAAGMVLGIMTHPGEVVAQQPLLQLADLDNLACVAEVDASEVPYLQSNQTATVSCRAFQDAVLEGTVDRVGNQITKATLRPLDPRKQVDRDVTKVVVLVDSKKAARLINASGRDRRAALVGLQVEVVFPLAKQVP
jgi:HlyD family secretion protein